jgi:hypothetical protein
MANPIPGIDPLVGNPNRANNAQSPQIMGLVPGRNNVMNPGIWNVPGANPRGPQMPPGFWFNVAPEKVGRVRLTGVCLEYGKPNPRPRFKYRMEPIRTATDRPEVMEVCAMLGRGEIGQRAAQLAAWHLNNDLSWQDLAAMRTRLSVGSKPTYSRQELRAARQAAEKAIELAQRRRKAREDTGKSLSQR